jgi:glutathione reductase (NADPH)
VTAESFDLVVIGTGAGGSAPATRCRDAGWRVAVIDDQPYGGTCALRGCDPKKILVGAAELADWCRRMSGFGVSADARIDWPELMRFKRSFTDPVPAQRQAELVKAGIATYHGRALLTGEDRLTVNGELLLARRLVIATGARPRALHIPGEEHLRTSTEFLELDKLPKRIAFVGAGYISFEFAHIAQRAGAAVTMLGRETALRQFDRDLTARLVEHTRSLGIDLRTDSEVTRVVQRDDCYEVHALTPDGEMSVSADIVVHGAGRIPDTERLGAREANVAIDDRGAVHVNEYLQSISNPRVYACGDSALPAGSLALTPVASHEGSVVASNLLHGNTRKADYRGVPSVVFTVPPVASVGLTEADVRRQGLDVRVNADETRSWYSNRRVRETAGMFKVIIDNNTDHVLGAHLFGPGAEEVINLFAVAIRHGITATALKGTTFSYPTRSSDLAYML